MTFRIPRRLGALLLALALCFTLLPAAALADGDDIFTVTYMTNAGVEMGKIEYTVGDTSNALPDTTNIVSLFSDFITRARQKGSVAVTPTIWYADADFTKAAVFPTDAEAGDNYTFYCGFTTGLILSGVSNGAENVSYSKTGGPVQPHLGASYGNTNARNDQTEKTISVFEKYVDGAWVEVDESYYTDYAGTEWPNAIYFSSVADSGTYRLKYLRYTATDNNGEILYYDTVYDNPDATYTVNITPVELSIDGVQAVDRNCDGTNEVSLTGGTLSGVLFGDNVSFELGKGLLADTAAGEDKAVTTEIRLTGEKAVNYTLAQPEGLLATITHSQDESRWTHDDTDHWHLCACGEKLNPAEHTFEWVTDRPATAVESGSKHEECTVCGYSRAAVEIPAAGINISTYEIITEKAANGSVTTSLSNASRGSVVTVTVEPREGYELSALTVTGPDGRIDVARTDGETYSFVMPEGEVTVRAVFAPVELPFTDVSSGAWYYDAVSYVYENGLMDGMGDGLFAPDNTMTRAMVWAILARMDGETVTGAGWKALARSWAVSSGVSDGTEPDALVTREQFATMLYRYAGAPEVGGMAVGEFADGALVSGWAYDAMVWALSEGIITGTDAGLIEPQGSATRAQAAAMLMRFCEGAES